MATKKNQQPLLYIQQPTFEKLTASMQQYYISRKPNAKLSTNPEAPLEVNNLIAEEKEEIKNEIILETNIPIKQDEIIDRIVDPLIDEFTEPKVMEFMLEGILSHGDEKELNETSLLALSLTNLPNDTKKDQQFDSTISLKRKKKAIAEEREPVEEESENLQEQSNLPEEKNDKKKKGKRTRFNQLSLANKLNQMRKMPAKAVKVLYEFVTEEKTYNGYLLSSKQDQFTINLRNSKQSVQIPEKNIIDINIIGI